MTGLRPSRIAFLLPTLDIGGAERVVLRTTAALDRTRFDPVVLALARGGGRLAEQLAAAGVPVGEFSASGHLAPLVVWRLLRWLRAHECDVLMTFMFHSNLVGRLVRLLRGVPIVVCSERAVWKEPGWRLAINRLTAPLADAITTNSREGVRIWAERLGIAESSIRLIYNGVDVDRFPPRAPRSLHQRDCPEVVIGSLARLHPLKGQDMLLDALAQLARRPDLPSWRGVLAGEGPDFDRLRQRSVALGLRDRVSFAGHVGAAERFLADLDVFVNASTTEGLPNAVLEAMASSLPVVATAVGGTAEVVDAGVTGWLVPSGDAAGLCGRLETLITDPALRAAMGEAGRLRVQRLFSVTQMVRDTERLLDEMLRGAAATQRSRVAH